ncbi:integral membrane sensor signal transduction histidine kinase [Phycicoccus sp. HDW14]|uniref:sensor histidine kinase n=1 Tax=Phycicoccus sp. HDW14 TaxID=2714941 RepID=UPI00140D2AD1|nr:histidine kinase [Phycicoccus sp. HDW14]QIM22818.1 integral membrane sensor signal transduction histidine kinase [Phycicoccus sp. HDW14]
MSDPAAAEVAQETVRPRRILAQLLGGVLAAMLLVGVLGAVAASKLAEREAVNDAASMAGVLAEAVVQPAMTDALMAGDPAAVDTFGTTIRRSLDADTVVRVKLWRPDGYVLYADEPQLIGRTFTLDDDQREALAGPKTVAEISRLGATENQFEVGDKLVEVYRPVWMPDGRTALFEIYVSYEPVAARTSQLWRGFAGVTASSLLLFVLIVTPLVLALTKRLRGAEAQRVALLQRAVDASSDERRRIAATLHDGPVQELAATSFTVSGASASAARSGDSALARDLDAAATAVRASIRSLRTLLVDLHPPALSRSGVVAALADLAQSVRAEDVVVRLDTDTDDELALTDEAQRLVHRVAQECVRNAAKHAGPADVLVSLHRTGPGVVTLDVVDDGRGFDVEAAMTDPEPGHLGTQLLAEAASVPGARLRVAAAPGAGTHWRLDLDGPMGVRA